ncbi:hypothetical protein P7C70_g8863, partial [Phenoliferia sp. Uapishka_3]
LGGGNEEGMKVIEEWLYGASWAVVVEKEGKKKERKEAEVKAREEVAKTLSAVMQVLGVLPLTLEHLRKSKIAKRVLAIGKSEKVVDPTSKKIAKELTEKWKKMQEQAKVTEGAAKRKADATDGTLILLTTLFDDGKLNDFAGPIKKAKVASTAKPSAPTSTSITKPKPAAPIVPLFTAKTPLPSFKKEKKPEPPPAPFDPFASALKLMGTKDPKDKDKAKADGGTAGVLLSTSMKGKEKRVKKSVRWETDENLEKIRFIEKAIYDGDDEEGFQGDQSVEAVRMMEEQEGQTLSMHLDQDMEEDVEWYEPILATALIIPDVREPESAESEIQRLREASAMEVDFHDDDPPPSAGEPPPHHQQDPPTQEIPLSEELRTDPAVMETIAHAQASGLSSGKVASQGDLNSLLQNLQQFAQQQNGGGAGTTTVSTPGFANLAVSQEQLQKVQQAMQGIQSIAPPPSHYGSGQPPFGQPPADSGWGGAHAAWGAQGQNANYSTQQPLQQQQQQWGGGSNNYQNHAADQPPPDRKRGVALKGKRGKQVCKFYTTAKGCDWGDRCSFPFSLLIASLERMER